MLEKILYLESAPSYLRKGKVSCKKENPETWDQKCLMYFLSTNLKAIIIFEINTL